ncbi:putative protein phosphatase 2C 76 [Zea mays]|uniref:Uncharacterized protein n=1 Tax=Zea mays TaxID=4577 RepID=A0A1D6H5I2_MAIZE|nr:putative protein phosphatase 2C 76 [Zea mays]
MVCIGSLLRALVLRAASSAGRRRGPRILCGRATDVRVTPRHGHGWRGFRAVTGRMMLDSSESASSAAAAAAEAGGAAAAPRGGGRAPGARWWLRQRRMGEVTFVRVV